MSVVRANADRKWSISLPFRGTIALGNGSQFYFQIELKDNKLSVFLRTSFGRKMGFFTTNRHYEKSTVFNKFKSIGLLPGDAGNIADIVNQITGRYDSRRSLGIYIPSFLETEIPNPKNGI